SFGRSFFLRGGNCLIYFCGSLFAPLSQGFGIDQFQISECLLGDLQTVACKWFALDLVRHVTGIVVFAVPGKAQHGSDNQLRRTSRARTFDRATDYLEARTEIRAIKTVAFKTITDRAIDKVVAREFAVVRCGIGIMI